MKYIVAILLSSISMTLLAQEDTFPKNEIKLNAYYLIAGAFELTYERAINEEASYGVSATYVFEDFEFIGGVVPYYRMYFGRKPNRGFFAEGNMFLGGLQDVYYDYNSNFFDYRTMTENQRFGFGLGIAIGGKFVTRRNVLVEITTGLGRIFEKENQYANFYPRGGITIGKAF